MSDWYWNVSEDRKWAEVFRGDELMARFRDDDEACDYVAAKAHLSVERNERAY